MRILHSRSFPQAGAAGAEPLLSRRAMISLIQCGRQAHHRHTGKRSQRAEARGKVECASRHQQPIPKAEPGVSLRRAFSKRAQKWSNMTGGRWMATRLLVSPWFVQPTSR